MIKAKNYPHFLSKILGKGGVSKVVLYSMFSINLVLVISYSIVIQQSMSTIFTSLSKKYQVFFSDSLMNRSSAFWLVLLNLMIIPFIYIKKYQTWRISLYVSDLSCIGMIACIIIICLFYQNEPSQKVFFDFGEFYISIPIILFAYASFHTIYDFNDEIYKSDVLQYKKSFLVQNMCTFVIVAVLGISCYYHFGEATLKTNGNILLIFDYNNIFSILANIFAVIFVTNGIIIKYQPTMQIMTLLLRKEYRDS